MVGLSADVVRRLPRGGHECHVYGHVSDSGEGRWTSNAAIEEGVPATLLTAALCSRFASRGSDLSADEVQSAQRLEFGGHVEMMQS
jgi:6-phosphogluconate dehydrogenase (decarboxylating)